MKLNELKNCFELVFDKLESREDFLNRFNNAIAIFELILSQPDQKVSNELLNYFYAIYGYSFLHYKVLLNCYNDFRLKFIQDLWEDLVPGEYVDSDDSDPDLFFDSKIEKYNFYLEGLIEIYKEKLNQIQAWILLDQTNTCYTKFQNIIFLNKKNLIAEINQIKPLVDLAKTALIYFQDVELAKSANSTEDNEFREALLNQNLSPIEIINQEEELSLEQMQNNFKFKFMTLISDYQNFMLNQSFEGLSEILNLQFLEFDKLKLILSPEDYFVVDSYFESIYGIKMQPYFDLIKIYCYERNNFLEKLKYDLILLNHSPKIFQPKINQYKSYIDLFDWVYQINQSASSRMSESLKLHGELCFPFNFLDIANLDLFTDLNFHSKRLLASHRSLIKELLAGRIKACKLKLK